jgi:hypothetical protein
MRRGVGQATLSWTAPDENTDGTPLINLAGYRIYYGTSRGRARSGRRHPERRSYDLRRRESHDRHLLLLHSCLQFGWGGERAVERRE